MDGALLVHSRLVVTGARTASAEPDTVGVRLSAPSRVTRVVALTAAVGTVAAVVACVAWSGRTTPPVTVGLSTPWLAVLLLAVTSVAEFTAVRLRRGDEVEALTLLEAAMVADVLLLPPSVATMVAILGLAVASLLDRRRAVMKTLFNLGSHATGTALLVSMVSAVRTTGTSLSATMVATLLAGTLTFAALNLGLLSWVLSAAGGRPSGKPLRTRGDCRWSWPSGPAGSARWPSGWQSARRRCCRSRCCRRRR